MEEFHGTRFQNGSFSLINVGSGFSLQAAVVEYSPLAIHKSLPHSFGA